MKKECLPLYERALGAQSSLAFEGILAQVGAELRWRFAFVRLLACCGVRGLRYVCRVAAVAVKGSRAVAGHRVDLEPGSHDVLPGVAASGRASWQLPFNKT